MAADEDLVAYLDPLIAETAGSTLFEEPLPDDVPAGIGITHYGGEPADDCMGPSLTPADMETVEVNVTVRNPVKATARARAFAVHALLHNLGPVEINGRTYKHVASTGGEPRFLRRDNNDRWLYVCDYRVQKDPG